MTPSRGKLNPLFMEEDKPGPNDLPDDRTLDLSNGKRIRVLRDGPYGFWKVRYDQGLIPDALLGQYTTFDKARKDIEIYFQKKNIQIVKKETVSA